VQKIAERGDVSFYKNTKGERFQKVCSKMLPVVNGKKKVLVAVIDGKYTVVYFQNGKYGYGVYKDGVKLFDNIWSMEEVEKKVKEVDMDAI